jgi:hypothetical protein
MEEATAALHAMRGVRHSPDPLVLGRITAGARGSLDHATPAALLD